MERPISLSKTEARKLVLHAQGLPALAPKGKALNASLAALERLSYVQIDTISVIQRAHHHTLWNRNPRYQLSHLDQLVKEQSAFEYWSHAAAYMPMSDYRFTLPRKQAIKGGSERHWYRKDEALMKMIVERIELEGPLMAKDFDGLGRKMADWQSKPTKQALENLFMQGDLMICRRQGFHKVYDLTERVLPSGTNTLLPSPEEHARFLILRYLGAHALGQLNEINYLLKNTKQQLGQALKEMLSAGEIIAIDVGKERYFALPQSLNLLQKPLRKSPLKILSPFDNLIIQRKRSKALFDFDYLLECYVPQNKRKHGYFVLPLLWEGKLQGRMDCKVDRKSAVLHILALYYEGPAKKLEEFASALSKELQAFMVFNGCHSREVHQCFPREIKYLL